MNVNFCAFKYRALYQHWNACYINVIEAFLDLGANVFVSPYLSFGTLPNNVKIGIESEQNSINIYNHTYLAELIKEGYYRDGPLLNLFVKPSGPTPAHFTIDTVGYGAYSSPSYISEYTLQNPLLLEPFFASNINPIIQSNTNKWLEPDLQFSDEEVEVPDNHILILGQMTADTTVVEFSFGDHWKKLILLVDELLRAKNKNPIVIKLHPSLKQETQKSGTWSWYKAQVKEWKNKGITVLEGWESIHKVLPKTKVAIIETSSSGIECLMHRVPIITYGFPEYIDACKLLKHRAHLNVLIDSIDSWYNPQVSMSWLYWYFNNYLCSTPSNTKERLKSILTKEGIFL